LTARRGAAIPPGNSAPDVLECFVRRQLENAAVLLLVTSRARRCTMLERPCGCCYVPSVPALAQCPQSRVAKFTALINRWSVRLETGSTSERGKSSVCGLREGTTFAPFGLPGTLHLPFDFSGGLLACVNGSSKPTSKRQQVTMSRCLRPLPF